MNEDETRAQLVGGRCLVVPGVRKGILRARGTVVVTPRRLLFLPDEGRGREAVVRLVEEADEDAMKEAVAVAAVLEGAIELLRGHPGLGPPDEDGRMRLGALGEEDDLLIPLDAQSLMVLVMGPRIGLTRSAPDPRQSTPAWSEAARRDRPPAWPSGVEGSEVPGWLGPISGATGALGSLLALPILVLLSVFLVEEVDDELGALVFLLGAAMLGLVHLASFVGATFAFVRREVTRLWGISTVAFAGLTGIFLLAGCLIALEELF